MHEHRINKILRIGDKLWITHVLNTYSCEVECAEESRL